MPRPYSFVVGILVGAGIATLWFANQTLPPVPVGPVDYRTAACVEIPNVECVPEAKILDRGCDPRYQDCEQVFYGQRNADGTVSRYYQQFRPWRGRHKPKQYGEKP